MSASLDAPSYLAGKLAHALADHVVAPLGAVPTVTLWGPDARRFANGMFTNNVRDLGRGSSQRTGLTDDRGRLWALAELHALADDRFRLHLDGQTGEAFTDRYEPYVVFDDVTIDVDVTAGATVQGPGAQEVLEAHGLPVPGPGAHAARDGLLVVARDRAGLGTGFDLWGPHDLPIDPDGEALLNALEVADAQVRMADVVKPGLPHEHGLRGAILHFEKGCYLGQESIHRIDVMGHPRRALAVVRGDALQAGPLEADGKVQGTVTRVGVDGCGAWLGLAVLRKPFDAVGAQLLQGDAVVQVVGPRPAGG